MSATDITTQFPTDSAYDRIAVVNPFDGVEVGSAIDIPPHHAKEILRIAKEGARLCRAMSRFA